MKRWDIKNQTNESLFSGETEEKESGFWEFWVTDEEILVSSFTGKIYAYSFDTGKFTIRYDRSDELPEHSFWFTDDYAVTVDSEHDLYKLYALNGGQNIERKAPFHSFFYVFVGADDEHLYLNYADILGDMAEYFVSVPIDGSEAQILWQSESDQRR